MGLKTAVKGSIPVYPLRN